MYFILKIQIIIGESMPNIKRSTIIDTNSMVYLGLYFEACEAADKKSGESMTKVLRGLREKGKITNKFFEETFLRHGFKLMQYLKKRENWEIYFSLFSQSELYRTLSERKFDEILTKNGVPFRIRKNKMDRTEIIFDYGKEVILKQKYVETVLAEMGIVLMRPENDDAIFKDTFYYIDAVSSTISLDVFDSYIYSLSLRIPCSEIYTNDREFLTTVNKINSPDRGEWRQISYRLRKKILMLPPYKNVKHNDLPSNIFPKGKNK